VLATLGAQGAHISHYCGVFSKIADSFTDCSYLYLYVGADLHKWCGALGSPGKFFHSETLFAMNS
jgi:hypothetical protein